MGILEVIYQAGYDAVIMESQFNTEKTNEHLAVLQKRNVDGGVIVFGFSDCDLTAIESLKHKAVVIAVDTDRISSVGYDNHGIIELAMNHFLQQGKRFVSYVGVDPSDKTTGLMRLNAYKACCQQAGIEPCYQTGAA